MTTRAEGTFEVRLSPLATHDQAEGSLLGRMSIDKQFHGDLEASSKGEMLSAGTGVKGSAGYVAIERVAGAEHLALAGGVEIAAELLVDRHPAQEAALGLVVGRQGAEPDFERASRT